MIPVVILLLIIVPVVVSPVCSQDQRAGLAGFGPSYVSDSIPDSLLPGHPYPVLITFRNTGLVSWHDEMRRIGLLYEGDMTKVTAIPSFVEISRDLNITPGKHATFGLTLLPVGLPGSYNLSFSVVMRSATGDQRITEIFVKRVTIVPTDGISSPVNGSVFVESSIQDLDVYLNSGFRGNVPAVVPDLRPGRYTLLVKNDTFEKTVPIDVERGTMTRILITGDDPEPVLSRKKAGPISDGTLIRFIEVNIPLIVIILFIILLCFTFAVHGVRKRNRLEEKREKEEEEENDGDPEKERLKREKLLLDKIHSQKPVFESLSPSSEPSPGGGMKKIISSSPPVQVSKRTYSRNQEYEKDSGSQKSTTPSAKPGSIHDVEVRLYKLTTRPGSATASLGVSNHLPASVSVQDMTISPGGFGIVPVELDEPTNDEPNMTVPLRILTEGSEFFKNIVIPYNRGIALLARGVVEKAYEYFRALVQAHPDNIDGLLHQAQILLNWGLDEEASSLIHEILALDPDNEEAKKIISRIQERAERIKETKTRESKQKIPGYPEELSDRYTPIRVLGDDPFATVILVRKNDTGDLRALKIPRIMEKVGSSLLTEISVLYQLWHPYVLRMYRAEFSPVVMLELEYVSGGWYMGMRYTRLSDVPVPLPYAQWFMMIQQIAEGLAYLHRQGVRHYHLTPKYVLLDEPFIPKISGLIRESLRSAGGSGDEEFFVRAPEQIDTHFFGKPGKRTDIFQLGALWLWLVTGQVMGTEGVDADEFSFTLVNGKHDPSLEAYVPLFKKLTATFKKDRYASVEEFLEELRKVPSEGSAGDDRISLGETR
ncbi:protein kinase [Methanospirillum sp.]|uniref:protein kinase domain-containing protein n=1 Tax=Methanospirillum sp. TaxID=45200 RepID=UPI002B643DAA|nr:protein kinase [Methanospirillum sp.]HPP78406.1 protein kinase [Methanospirillum sp.]